MFADDDSLGIETANYIRFISFQLMAIIWRINMYEVTYLFILIDDPFFGFRLT